MGLKATENKARQDREGFVKPGSYIKVFSPEGESMKCHVDDIPGGYTRSHPDTVKEEGQPNKKAPEPESKDIKKDKQPKEEAKA